MYWFNDQIITIKGGGAYMFSETQEHIYSGAHA